MHATGGGTTSTASPPVTQAAVFAECGPGTGVYATSDTGTAVQASSDLGTAVQGTAQGNDSGFGVGVSAQAINPASIALQVIGKIQVQGKSAGQVTLAAGKKTLNVSNAAATANSLIFLTPLDTPPQAFLSIGARSAGSFTIDASTAPTKAMTIGFLIIN